MKEGVVMAADEVTVVKTPALEQSEEVLVNDNVDSEGKTSASAATEYATEIEAPNAFAEILPPASLAANEIAYDKALSSQTDNINPPDWTLAPVENSAIVETQELPQKEVIEIPSIEQLVTPLPEVTDVGGRLSTLEVSDQAEKIESREATPAPKKAVEEDILASYKERFGINKEDLEGIEGFEKLSRGQQRQALENLAQLSIGRIHEGAIDGHNQAVSSEHQSISTAINEKKRDAKFFGKIYWALEGAMDHATVAVRDSFTKKFDTIKREKQLAGNIEKGGIDEHKVVLEQMVKGMKELGPAIKEGEDGQLEVQFVETVGMSPELGKIAEAFNEQGTKFSKIPYEWSLDSATPAQQEAFNNAKETYELQRGVLIGHMAEVGGDIMATKAMAKTESIIEMQRFIQTAPDASEELKNIEDQNAWTAALKSVGTERGLYMAGGAIARTALGAMAGFVAAPAVAAASAGIRGWRKAGETLAAQDKAQREGQEIPQTKAMKDAQERMAKITIDLAHVDDERAKADLVAELRTLNKTARGTTKNMIAAWNEDDIAGDKDATSGDRRRGAAAKIDYLRMQIASIDNLLKTGPAADEAGNFIKEKEKLTAQLERRMNYTKMKIADRKMIWGGKDERLDNQYALTRSMSAAEVLLATGTATDERGDTSDQRLEKLLGDINTEIKSSERWFRGRQAIQAGALGGVLAGAGAEFADAVRWMNGTAGTLTERAFGNAADVKSGIVRMSGAAAVGARDALVSGIMTMIPGAEAAELPSGGIPRGSIAPTEIRPVLTHEATANAPVEQPKLVEKAPIVPRVTAMNKEVPIAQEAMSQAMERTNKIAASWADIAANGLNKNEHWGSVRGMSLREAASAPLRVENGASLEAAQAQMHALLGKAEAMGFHATKDETTAGAFLDRVSRELREPASSERVLARSQELYKVIYNFVPIHGQMRPMSADAIMGQKLLIGLEDTPSGKEFLHWKKVLSSIERGTGIPPAPNEDIQAYVERATRVSLKKDPTLHVNTLLGTRIDEANLVTPKSALTTPMQAPTQAPRIPEEVVQQRAPSPLGEKPKIIEQTPRAAEEIRSQRPIQVERQSAPMVEKASPLPKTETVRAPYSGQEAQMEKLLQPQIEAARRMFGPVADRPAIEVINGLDPINHPENRQLSEQFGALAMKGYVPKQGESAVEFYARAMKEEMLKTRVPTASGSHNVVSEAAAAEKAAPSLNEVKPNIAFQPGHEQMRGELAGIYERGADSSSWRGYRGVRASVALDSSFDSISDSSAHTVPVRQFLESKGITLKSHPAKPGETLEQYFARVRGN